MKVLVSQHIKITGVISILLCSVFYCFANESRVAPAGRLLKFTDEQLALPGKKGIGLTLRSDGHRKGGSVTQNIAMIKELNVCWNYSWGCQYVEQQPADIEFIPMIWGDHTVKEKIETVVLPNVQSGKSKRLLGFNEPDKSDQADMSYMRAIELWPELEKAGVPLCSPSPANPEGKRDSSGQGVRGTWMADFMEEADDRGYRIDYIGVHWYGGCDPEAFKEKMKRIYRQYDRRPLLITEFAPADWKARSPEEIWFTPADVLEFMKDVLPWLEKQDWIAGYAWFSFGINSRMGTSSALFNEEGNLTACGRFYKSVTPENPRGDRGIKADKPHHKK